jgi:hypothetical protein
MARARRWALLDQWKGWGKQSLKKHEFMVKILLLASFTQPPAKGVITVSAFRGTAS